MSKCIVDDLESIEIQEQDSEIFLSSGIPIRGSPLLNHLIERSAEDTAIGQPVNGSSAAIRATCASASLRFVMSVTVCTKLPSGRWPLRTRMTLPFGMRCSQSDVWVDAGGASVVFKGSAPLPAGLVACAHIRLVGNQAIISWRGLDDSAGNPNSSTHLRLMRGFEDPWSPT